MIHKILAGILWFVVMFIPYILASLSFIVSVFTDPFGWSAVKWYSEYFYRFVAKVGKAIDRRLR